MDEDGVSTDDMPAFRRSPDPLDAVLSGDRSENLRDLTTIVDDMTTAYVPSSPVPREPELLQFTNAPAGRAAAPAPTARRRRAVAAVAAFAATFAGKAVIGGAVAAATLGGLHAADKVDIPLLPDVDRDSPATTIEQQDDRPGTHPVPDRDDQRPGTAPDEPVPGTVPPDQSDRQDDTPVPTSVEPPAGTRPEGDGPATEQPPGRTDPAADERPGASAPVPTTSTSVPAGNDGSDQPVPPDDGRNTTDTTPPPRDAGPANDASGQESRVTAGTVPGSPAGTS